MRLALCGKILLNSDTTFLLKDNQMFGAAWRQMMSLLTGNKQKRLSYMKLKGLRWWIIGLIGVATIINYIDRSAINIMWPYIYKEFGIADVDNKNALALITTFFMVAYAIGQTATGKMMDVIGTRMGMVVSIIAWSASIALHALASSLRSFSVFRFFL